MRSKGVSGLFQLTWQNEARFIHAIRFEDLRQFKEGSQCCYNSKTACELFFQRFCSRLASDDDRSSRCESNRQNCQKALEMQPRGGYCSNCSKELFFQSISCEKHQRLCEQAQLSYLLAPANKTAKQYCQRNDAESLLEIAD